MSHSQLASESEMRLDFMDNGSTELKWCIFTKGLRGPIAKIIVDTRQLTLQVENNEPIAHIVNVFVRPEFRGKKLGEHLVRLAQMAMRENGFVWLTLEAEENVENHGRLVALYERCGFHIYPVADKYPMEYNGDECFRKVPMRCKLPDVSFPFEQEQQQQQHYDAIESPPSMLTTTTTTGTNGSSSSSSIAPLISKFASVQFVEEMKRESLQLLQACSLNVDVINALDYIDQHIAPGIMEQAFRTGLLVRSLGHPDWMELAGYLRHLGRIQEKWTNWHVPFMVQIVGGNEQRRVRGHDDDGASADEEETVDEPIVKSGPLPQELCEEGKPIRFIDPERYSQQGVDESVLTWSPCEYAFLSLTFGNRSSAPPEMAQVLRYCNCDSWLNTDEFTYLEAWGDPDLKQLTIRFKAAMTTADQSEMLTASQMDEARARYIELVDKYISDVRVM